MTTEKLREFWLAKPFERFAINLVDGRSLQVTHPESLSHVPKGRSFVLMHSDNTVRVVDLLHVIDIEISGPDLRLER